MFRELMKRFLPVALSAAMLFWSTQKVDLVADAGDNGNPQIETEVDEITGKMNSEQEIHGDSTDNGQQNSGFITANDTGYLVSIDKSCAKVTVGRGGIVSNTEN